MKKTRFMSCITAMCIFIMTFACALSISAEENTELSTIQYAGNTVKFAQKSSGTLIAACYGADGVLKGLKTYDVEDTEEFEIPRSDASEYDGNVKFMLWSDFSNITPNAKSAEKAFVSLSAADIDEAKSDVDAGLLYFYPAGTTRNSVKYVLEENAECYVNGVYMGAFDTDAFERFIVNDSSALVTLQRNASDEKYNVIMITVYGTAVVDEVLDRTDSVKIYFKDQSEGLGSASMTVDKNDDAMDYNFTLNGEKIAPADLKEYDVLTIAYDVENFKDSNFYDVQVSRTTAEGKYTGRNSTGDEFTIGGEKYKIANGMYWQPEIASEYKLYLDVFGRIAYAVETANAKKFGILKNVYAKANGDWVAEVIKKDGTAQEYTIDDTYGEEYRALILEGSKTETYPQQVIEYIATASGKLTIRSVDYNDKATAEYPAAICNDQEYKESTNKIGSIKIADRTTIIDISNIDNDANSHRAVTADRLIDGEMYKAYGYDKSNADGVCNFVIITEGNIVPSEEEYTEDIGILKNVYVKANGDWAANVISSSGADMEFTIDEQNSTEYTALISDSDKRSEAYPKQVVSYKTTVSGRLTIESVLTGVLISGAYSKADSTIGSLNIEDTTKIVDISNVDNDRYDFGAVSLDRLTDGGEYTVYSYRSTDEDNAYDLILITAGDVAAAEEKYTEDIGILTNVYQKSNGDYMAEVITKDGAKAEFLLDDENGAGYKTLVLSADRRTEAYPQQVIRYRASASGKMTIINTDDNGNAVAETAVSESAEYNAGTGELGSIRISDNTVIIDISNVDDKKDDFYIVSKNNLRDGAMFEAYGYDKSDEDGSFGFVIITKGVGGPNSDSQLAVFLDSDTDIDADGNDVDTMTIYYNNEEVTYMIDEDSTVDVTDYEEGDLLIFSLNLAGKIDRAYPVFNNKGLLYSAGNYTQFRDNVFLEGSILNQQDWQTLLSDSKENVDINFGVIVRIGGVYALAEEIVYDGINCYIDLSKAKELIISPNTKIYTYNFANSIKNHNRIVLDDGMHITPDITAAYEYGDRNSDIYYIAHEDVIDSIVFAAVRTFDGDEVQEIYQIVND